MHHATSDQAMSVPIPIHQQFVATHAQSSARIAGCCTIRQNESVAKLCSCDGAPTANKFCYRAQHDLNLFFNSEFNSFNGRHERMLFL
jgi:hypothetical protein